MTKNPKKQKVTILLEIAALIRDYNSISINKIHNANGRYCVSGDRRLRLLKAMFWKHLGYRETAYIYNPHTPKSYSFKTPFRHFCKTLLSDRRIHMGKPVVRVQIGQGGEIKDQSSKRTYRRSCAFCGAVMRFKTKYRNKQYCSAKCRAAAWRLRNRTSR